MKKIIIALGIFMVVILAAVGVAYAWLSDSPYSMMEYHVTAKEGDTIWGICSRIATDRDNLQRVVFQAMKDSHIEHASDLQPGQTVIVRVKPVNEK